MARLSKTEILAANDLKTETVDVPEWGGSVEIRSWSVAQADAFGKMIRDGQENGGFAENLRETVAQLSIVGEDGELLFSPDEIESFSKKSTEAMNRVHKAAMRLNGLMAKEEDAKND